MALSLHTAELLFLKALVEDRVDKLDRDLESLGSQRRAFSQAYDTDTPVSDEELSILIVRQTHANILRKVQFELDIPWRETVGLVS